MKPTFKFILTIVLLLTSAGLFAQFQKDKEKKRYEHFKERNISKSYPASGNSLSIDNQFGDVKITTWDKNEIKVDIHIEASSTNEDMAEKTFNKIDVTDKQEGKEISFVTKMGKGENINCNNCSNTMDISYDIHMPSSNKLMIKNSFGDVIIPDYTGEISITSMYGSLTAGKFKSLGKLVVQFGRADMKNLSNTDVTFGYSTINIESLSGNNKIKMEFCSYSTINLNNDLASLTLINSYSKVHLQPVANFSASYDISTSYGDFVNKTNADIKRTDKSSEYGPDLNQHYEGKSGSGAAKIIIKSSFGGVLIGEGSEADMKEKKKVRV